MRKHHFYKGRALDQELRFIYQDKKGKLPDMSHLEHEYHRRTTRLLFGIILFLATVITASWLGFFFFGTQGKGGGEITLSLDGPQEVVSGVPQEVIITYKNSDRKPLAFGALRLRLPDNILLKEASPKPENGRLEWNFGTIPARSSGELRLRLIPYGFVDDTLELQSIFSYKPADFNAEFKTSKTHTFTIRAHGVHILLSGPASTVPGEELEIRGEIKNETDETFDNVQATLTPPSTFILDDTDPKVDKGVWALQTLLPGEKKEIKFKGTFLSSAQGAQDLVIEVSKTEGTARLYPLGKEQQTIEVKGSDLQLDLFINNNPEIKWLRLGDTFRLALKLQNRASEPISGLHLTIPVTSDLIDWKNANAHEGIIAGSTITFPAVDEITLNPGQSTELSATLPLMKSAPLHASPFIELEAQALYKDGSIRTPKFKLTIVSDLTLASEARYFSATGTPQGSGPLPPKVGQETKFTVRFKIKNTFHDLSEIAVIANLPEGVKWSGAQLAQEGKLSFNESAREVRWDVPRMPITTPELSAEFSVIAKPKEDDRGKLLLLLGVSRAQATDTIMQTVFSTDAPSLSSSLEADPFGRGKGVVQ